MIGTRYHFEGKDKQGKPIIIDLANLDSIDGRMRVYPYELMIMRPNGTEIAYSTHRTLAEAAKAYENSITLYALKEGENAPLKGKYAKLRDDLKAALAVAEQSAENVEDSGTCNMDACAVYLPRWRASLVEQAAQKAGTGCGDWTLFGKKLYVFFPRVSGQAYRREVAAEAMTAEMKRRGYDAFNYQAMD